MMAACIAGCASTGTTFRSGVGDSFLEDAPWYAGDLVNAGNDIGHLPIRFQADAAFSSPGLKMEAGSPLAALIDEMNAYLDATEATLRIAPLTQVVGDAPDVQFGCEAAPGAECAGYEEHRQMRLAIGRPSSSWKTWATNEAGRIGAARVLAITLEIGNYMPRQRDWKGSKEIRLGTGYTVDVPWLTSLDAPASVLQLTGALLDQNGKAIRIGAEGLIARRTNVALSGFGIQRIIDDNEIEQIRSLRRDDLPGKPLVWQVALDHMVAQLTGAAALASR